MPLYQQLADYLTDLIHRGVYRAGEKLPSLRDMATQKQLSIPTVQRAYELLEDRRQVEVRAKSGFYVRSSLPSSQQILPLPEFAAPQPSTVNVHDMATGVFQRCDEAGIINLGTAYPSAAYLPVRPLQRIASGLIKHNMEALVEAHFSPGTDSLRHVLSQRLAEIGCSVPADQLVITNGCQEALAICLRVVAQPGDTIAIESPGFVGLLQLIEFMGYKTLEIPCDPERGMSLGALEMALQQWPVKAVALVSSYSNPSGSSMPPENRQRLVSLLHKNSIPLIEDDLFGDLSFSGVRDNPCKAWDENDLVLYCSSASKSIAPGLRVGWIAPGRYLSEVEYFKAFFNVGVPSFSQLLIAEFMRSGQYDRHLRQLRTLLARQMQNFLQWIFESFPEGTRCSHPYGGYVLWVRLPEGVDAMMLHQQAYQSGIGIVPGQLCAPYGDKYSHYIRINCAASPEQNLQSAIQTLGFIAKRMMSI
ncbi:MAG: PLP-dependent aminotransferase family protein [Motiliproteus sp.]